MAPFKLRFRMGGGGGSPNDTEHHQVNEALIPIQSTKIRGASCSTIDSADCHSLGTNECKSLLSATSTNSECPDWNCKELSTIDDSYSDCFQLEPLTTPPPLKMSNNNSKQLAGENYDNNDDNNEGERNSLKSINDMASPTSISEPLLLQESMLDSCDDCHCEEYGEQVETEMESNFAQSCDAEQASAADCNCTNSLNSLNTIYGGGGHCIDGAHYEEQMAIDSENGWGTQADFNEYQEQYQQRVDNCLTPEILSNKSSKEIYKDLATAMGITCKMSDGCRCMECQSHYFDCEFEENDHQKNDGGLGAGTPMFLSEVMHGSACTIL